MNDEKVPMLITYFSVSDAFFLLPAPLDRSVSENTFTFFPLLTTTTTFAPGALLRSVDPIAYLSIAHNTFHCALYFHGLIELSGQQNCQATK